MMQPRRLCGIGVLLACMLILSTGHAAEVPETVVVDSARQYQTWHGWWHYNYGLIHASYADGAETWEVMKKYYGFAQYTRFIRPGYRMIAISADDAVSFVDPAKGSLIIVAYNETDQARRRTYDLKGFMKVGEEVEVYRTSQTEDLEKKAPIAVEGKRFSVEEPGPSVNTYIVEGVAYTGAAVPVEEDMWAGDELDESDIPTDVTEGGTSISDFNDSTMGDWTALDNSDGVTAASGDGRLAGTVSSGRWFDAVYFRSDPAANRFTALRGDFAYEGTVDFAQFKAEAGPGSWSALGMGTLDTVHWDWHVMQVFKDHPSSGPSGKDQWVVLVWNLNSNQPLYHAWTPIPENTKLVTFKIVRAGKLEAFYTDFHDGQGWRLVTVDKEDANDKSLVLRST